MNATEKLEANELKEKMHAEAKGKCFYCGKDISLYESQLAHVLPKHKKYIKKYGRSVIFHPMNMIISCPGCNYKALLDPASHPVEAAELVKKIHEDIGDKR